MLQLKEIARRLRVMADRQRFEAELDEELRFHLDREIEANVARGMTPEEAYRAATRAFGGVEQTKIECREAAGFRFWKPLLLLGKSSNWRIK